MQSILHLLYLNIIAGWISMPVAAILKIHTLQKQQHTLKIPVTYLVIMKHSAGRESETPYGQTSETWLMKRSLALSHRCHRISSAAAVNTNAVPVQQNDPKLSCNNHIQDIS